MIYWFDTDHIRIAQRESDAAYDALAPRDFSAVAVLPFDEAAAVFDDRAAQRLRIGRMDLRIASIALARELVVATRSARDFGQAPNLRIEDWTG